MVYPTEEQQAAVAQFLTGRPLKITAFAGSGKTATLRMLAQASHRRGIYLAFNKAVAAEASATFPPWAKCQGLRMKIAEIFDGMEFGVVRGVFLRSGDPHVGKDFGGRILGLGRPPLWRQGRAPAD